MIDQKKIYDCLQKEGVDFITGVPDSLLNEFCLYVNSILTKKEHVIAANEGNAVALAAGHHIATGGIPLVYMQNSGIGNAMNPLLSLTNKDVYSIPMVLLIGWRGDPSVKDHAHHKKQGQLTPTLLDNADIPFKIIDENEQNTLDAAKWAVKTAKNISSPVALLAKKGVFEKGIKKDLLAEPSKFSMSRENAIKCTLECAPKDAICIATTGRATRELYELRNINGIAHDMDFLNVGAMGHASSISAGIALGAKKRIVICFDGDAAAVMHLGALTTTGLIGPKNFLHIVLNNGSHESVGGQPSVGFNVNLTAIAESAGYKTVGAAVDNENALKNAIIELTKNNGPAFIDAHIRKGIRKNIPPLNVSYLNLKENLMKNIKNSK